MNILAYFPIRSYDTVLFEMISGVSIELVDRDEFIGYSLFEPEMNDEIESFNNKTDICFYN